MIAIIVTLSHQRLLHTYIKHERGFFAAATCIYNVMPDDHGTGTPDRFATYRY